MSHSDEGEVMTMSERMDGMWGVVEMQCTWLDEVKWSKRVETKASCVVWGSVRSATQWVTSKIVRWSAHRTCREACASLV